MQFPLKKLLNLWPCTGFIYRMKLIIHCPWRQKPWNRCFLEVLLANICLKFLSSRDGFWSGMPALVLVYPSAQLQSHFFTRSSVSSVFTLVFLFQMILCYSAHPNFTAFHLVLGLLGRLFSSTRLYVHQRQEAYPPFQTFPYYKTKRNKKPLKG